MKNTYQHHSTWEIFGLINDLKYRLSSIALFPFPAITACCSQTPVFRAQRGNNEQFLLSQNPLNPQVCVCVCLFANLLSFF